MAAEERNPFDPSADRREDDEGSSDEKFEDILYLKAYTGQFDRELQRQDAEESVGPETSAQAPKSKLSTTRLTKIDLNDSDSDEPLDELKLGGAMQTFVLVLALLQLFRIATEYQNSCTKVF
jgi:hypothetical protein